MSARHEFCTLFDSNYLAKAVAMHRSLLRHGGDFHLTAVCFDGEAKRLLDRLALPRLTAVPVEEVEAFDAELLATKPDRSPTEYCWTATPAIARYVMATRPEVADITYLDADLMFFASPQLLFDEIGAASVCITPHRYAPEHAHQIVNGIYCVQWVTFKRDERGREALEWWHDRCIEWCYYRLEDGKLGDQKYLDDWPERFEGVHVLEHKGGGLAPWNVTQYAVEERDGHVFVDDDPLVFFHYHRVRLQAHGGHAWEPPGYPISERVRELVYDPYLEELDAALAQIRAVEPGFAAGVEPRPALRRRAQDVRTRVGTRMVERFPFLLKVRYPRGVPGSAARR
jgi:hypothetical protein